MPLKRKANQCIDVVTTAVYTRSYRFFSVPEWFHYKKTSWTSEEKCDMDGGK